MEAIQSMEKILTELQIKNILLVRGNYSYTKSGAKEALASALEDLNVIEFSEFSVNPKLEEAQIGFELFKKNNIDVIIAIGGGSVIDTAKIIKYLAIKDNAADASIPFIAAPTTAGTGSEATHFAVVYIRGEKHSWDDESLIPTVALVDANLLKGQSNYQMAVSGIDAFAQGIESMWSINSTEESRKYSEKAIKLIWENLESAINGDKEALAKIAQGSNWAGKAINIAKTTAAHALSYGFTKKLGLPHGHAVSISIPFFINLHLNISPNNCNDMRGITHVNDIMCKISKILNIAKNKLTQAILAFYKTLGVSISFKELEITNDIFIEATKQINYERLKNNPVNIDTNTLQLLFKNDLDNVSAS